VSAIGGSGCAIIRLDLKAVWRQHCAKDLDTNMAQQRLVLVLDDVVDGQPVGPPPMPVELLSGFQIAPVSNPPAFDPAAFAAMAAKGREAWAEVADASQWVEELRGNGC